MFLNAPCQGGDISLTQPVVNKKRLCIEATDPEVKLPASHTAEGWIALDGKRLVAQNRCVFFSFPVMAVKSEVVGDTTPLHKLNCATLVRKFKQRSRSYWN